MICAINKIKKRQKIKHVNNKFSYLHTYESHVIPETNSKHVNLNGVGLRYGRQLYFIVFSNIWSSVRLKIPPQFQAYWQHRLFSLDMASLIKNDSFSFYLYITLLLVFLCLIAANKSVLSLYACAHKISLKYLFSRKKLQSKYVVQHILCDNRFFLMNFQCLSNKTILNIYTRILYIMKLQYNCFICQEITYHPW